MADTAKFLTSFLKNISKRVLFVILKIKHMSGSGQHELVSPDKTIENHAKTIKRKNKGLYTDIFFN